MRRKYMKLAVIALACVLSFGSLGDKAKVLAATNVVDLFEGSNIEAQNYETWTSTIRSYLTADEEGKIMCVRIIRADNGRNYVVASYYDEKFHITDIKKIELDLPIWGGFYDSKDYYFVVTGQENKQEDAKVACYCITKYDKAWNKINSVDVKDCNTIIPFDAGTVRMCEYQGYLLIRTCHAMYTTSDGLNHQANVTLAVNMDTLELNIKNAEISNVSTGYVSHSFNQFITMDGEKVIALDHGDAYPRCLCLQRAYCQVSGNSLSINNQKNISVMDFPGKTGNNDTGASVGGLELSEDAYLVAGNSVVQDEKNTERKTRNIFVASVEKDLSKAKINWFTSIEEGKGTTSTPHLIKIDSNKFMLMWDQSNMIYYALLDGKGNQMGEVYSHKGNLSDCKPVLIGNKITWFTANGLEMNFHQISLEDLFYIKIGTVGGHQYHKGKPSKGVVTLKCDICGNTEKMPVITSLNIWFNLESDGTGSYWEDNYFFNGIIDKHLEVGEKINFFKEAYETPEGVNKDYIISVSNDDILSYVRTGDDSGYFLALKEGKVILTISSLWNSELVKKYTIFVGDYVSPISTAMKKAQTGIKSIKKSGKNAMKIIWNPTENAYGYEIQYSLNSDFLKKTTKMSRNTSLDIKKLKKGKKYFVRVRPYCLDEVDGRKVYGNWSEVFTYKN